MKYNGVEYNGGGLGEKMGIEILEASPETVRAKMPVKGNTQPYGLLHGGASAVLAETVGSVGAMLHAGEGNIAVGIEVNATHHRGVREGFVHALAHAAHRGRSVATYIVEITDDAGKRVASARLTAVIRPA